MCISVCRLSTIICSAVQRGFSECVKILETYGLKRLPSSVSIASQFQIPSSSPHDVDEYGHVPLHRPQHRPLSSTPSDAHTLPSLSGLPLDRGTADGIDRISRPGSGFEHIHDSTGVDVLAGLRQDNGMGWFKKYSHLVSVAASVCTNMYGDTYVVLCQCCSHNRHIRTYIRIYKHTYVRKFSLVLSACVYLQLTMLPFIVHLNTISMILNDGTYVCTYVRTYVVRTYVCTYVCSMQ